MIEEPVIQKKKKTLSTVKPKLAFLGVGWIGKNRMEAIIDSNYAECVILSDISKDIALEAAKKIRKPKILYTIEEVINEQPHGLVVATPSALHAKQSLMALEAGIPVFCQKPLGRDKAETEAVVKKAEEKNLLLGVDLSYRYTNAVQGLKKIIDNNQLGDLYAVDLTFHNAYGPDKNWFYNPKLSGGGCVIDLGVHLIDMAMWMLGFPEVEEVSSQLYSHGKKVMNTDEQVEDYATAQLKIKDGPVIRLTCSWKLPVGKDAEISAAFYGTKAGAEFKNINGSFYDFEAHLYEGTDDKLLVEPPDDWSGKAAVKWAEQLQQKQTFNKEAWEYVKVAEILDRIYDR